MRLLVALEARLATGPDGAISSSTGVEGPAFWKRYLDVFEHVTVAARTMAPSTGGDTQHPASEGPRLTVAAVYGNVVVARRPLPPSSAATPHRTLAPLACGATEAA